VPYRSLGYTAQDISREISGLHWKGSFGDSASIAATTLEDEEISMVAS